MIPKWLKDKLRSKRAERFDKADKRFAEQQARLQEAVRALVRSHEQPKKDQGQ